MWDYDGLVGKARVYFKRADAVGKADDDAFAIWLLLGLEFLLRAPLARVNPMLLADPNGEAVMHAAGFPAGPDAKDPKSIQIATAIVRLRRMIPEFTSDRESDAGILAALRNRELHTSEAALASIDVSLWLPRFTRVAEVVCDHLGLRATDIVGDEVMRQGRALVDAEDKKLSHEVATRIEAAAAFVEKLSEEEVASRYEDSRAWRARADVVVKCPGCELDVALELETIRTTNERLDEGEISRDIISVAHSVECPVCGLRLANTAEVKAAGLPQQHTRTDIESFEDRYLSFYEPDDYGND